MGQVSSASSSKVHFLSQRAVGSTYRWREINDRDNVQRLIRCRQTADRRHGGINITPAGGGGWGGHNVIFIKQVNDDGGSTSKSARRTPVDWATGQLSWAELSTVIYESRRTDAIDSVLSAALAHQITLSSAGRLLVCVCLLGSLFLSLHLYRCSDRKREPSSRTTAAGRTGGLRDLLPGCAVPTAR